MNYLKRVINNSQLFIIMAQMNIETVQLGNETLVRAQHRPEKSKANDVIALVDNSGSMAGQPIENACNGLIDFLDKLADPIVFTLIVFNSSIRVEKHYTSKKTAIEEIRGIRAGGMTNHELALSTAMRYTNKGSSVVFLTDGDQTCGNYTRVIQQFKDDCTKKEVQVNSIGLGQCRKDFLLQLLQNDGAVYYCDSSSEVKNKLAECCDASSVKEPIAQVMIDGKLVGTLPMHFDQNGMLVSVQTLPVESLKGATILLDDQSYILNIQESKTSDALIHQFQLSQLHKELDEFNEKVQNGTKIMEMMDLYKKFDEGLRKITRDHMKDKMSRDDRKNIGAMRFRIEGILKNIIAGLAEWTETGVTSLSTDLVVKFKELSKKTEQQRKQQIAHARTEKIMNERIVQNTKTAASTSEKISGHARWFEEHRKVLEKFPFVQKANEHTCHMTLMNVMEAATQGSVLAVLANTSFSENSISEAALINISRIGSNMVEIDGIVDSLNFQGSIPDSHRGTFSSCIPVIPIFFPNEDEMKDMTNEDKILVGEFKDRYTNLFWLCTQPIFGWLCTGEPNGFAASQTNTVLLLALYTAHVNHRIQKKEFSKGTFDIVMNTCLLQLSRTLEYEKKRIAAGELKEGEGIISNYVNEVRRFLEPKGRTKDVVIRLQLLVGKLLALEALGILQLTPQEKITFGKGLVYEQFRRRIGKISKDGIGEDVFKDTLFTSDEYELLVENVVKNFITEESSKVEKVEGMDGYEAKAIAWLGQRNIVTADVQAEQKKKKEPVMLPVMAYEQYNHKLVNSEMFMKRIQKIFNQMQGLIICAGALGYKPEHGVVIETFINDSMKKDKNVNDQFYDENSAQEEIPQCVKLFSDNLFEIVGFALQAWRLGDNSDARGALERGTFVDLGGDGMKLLTDWTKDFITHRIQDGKAAYVSQASKISGQSLITDFRSANTPLQILGVVLHYGPMQIRDFKHWRLSIRVREELGETKDQIPLFEDKCRVLQGKQVEGITRFTGSDGKISYLYTYANSGYVTWPGRQAYYVSGAHVPFSGNNVHRI